MKLYKTREFARQARQCRLADAELREAVQRAEQGLVDAGIGAYLVKQRVARKGQGRSRGYRTIIFLKEGDRAVFLHLFEKSRQSNLTIKEEEAFRDFARSLACLDNQAFASLVETRGWERIDDEK